MDRVPPLPEGIDPTDGQSLIEWAEELGVSVHFEIVEGFPSLPFRLSEYTLHPPEIRLWRYVPWEPWLQEVCERSLMFVAPWFLIYLARELYRHLESQGLYSLEAPWYRPDQLWAWHTLDRRADAFAMEVLGMIRKPSRLDRTIEESLAIGGDRPSASR